LKYPGVCEIAGIRFVSPDYLKLKRSIVSQVRREPGFISISPQRKMSCFRYTSLLPDVHIVKLGGVEGQDLDLLNHSCAGGRRISDRRVRDEMKNGLPNFPDK
jgi:hypothetical protein